MIFVKCDIFSSFIKTVLPFLICLLGIICAEGALWKDQRKLITAWLKSFGMSKHGASREKLEKRIASGVCELLEVYFYLLRHCNMFYKKLFGNFFFINYCFRT